MAQGGKAFATKLEVNSRNLHNPVTCPLVSTCNGMCACVCMNACICALVYAHIHEAFSALII